MRDDVKRKLPDLGFVKPFEVWLAAFRDRLTPDDAAVLVKWRRSKKDPVKRLLWESAIEGLKDRVKELYLTRWSRQHGKPISAWKEPRGALKHFREAAIGVLQQGQNVKRLLDCAEDMVPAFGRRKKLVYPMPSHLAGPYVQQAMQEWVPPDERDEEFLTTHPERLAEATEAYRKKHPVKTDPWIKARVGMGHIDFTKADQSWRKKHASNGMGENGSSTIEGLHDEPGSDAEPDTRAGGLQVGDETA